MKKQHGLKKTAALIMSMALAAGALPVNAGGFFKSGSAIVANAAEEEKTPAEAKTPALGTFYREGDTIAVTGDTWFKIDDDPHSGYPVVKIDSDLKITEYESSDKYNQYVWKTGETMFTEVHNGFYITREDPEADAEGFYITGGKGTQNDPFIIGLSAPKFCGKNLTLSDGIGLNFIVDTINEGNAADIKVKISGNCEDEGTQSLYVRNINGQDVYCATANVAANNMDSVITAELYYGGSETPVDTLSFSANDYLDTVDTSSDAQFKALVDAAKQYGQAASAYFGKGDIPAVKDHTDDIVNATVSFGKFSFSKYAPMFDSSVASISLVLNSKLAVRLYTAKYEDTHHNIAAYDMWTYDENNKLVISPFSVIEVFQGSNGKYCFEIPGIKPTQLGTTFNVNYQGTDYLFTPMAWAYRVLSKEGAPQKDVAMANALYEYFIAATDYAGN